MTNLELFMALGNISSENLSGAEELQNKPCVRTNHKMQMKRAVLIAAVIALTLLLVGCAVVYVLRMQDVKIGEATETRDYRLVDGTYVEDPHEVNQNVLTLAGLKGTKAYQACADFFAFKEEYTQNMEAMMNNGTLPEDFFENDTYGKAMNAKASELAAQYGLKNEGESLNFRTTRNMCDALGIERFMKESEEISARVSGGSCYNTGNFCLYFDFDFPEEQNYEVLHTSGYLRWNRTDCFSQDYVALVDTGDWIERNYTTASGSKVLILQSPTQETGYILCDRGDALMSLSLSVNIEILSEDHGVVTAEYQHMTDRQIELVADAIDFAIQPKIPTQADVDAQAEIPQEATQNGYTLRLKSVETDGYVARILLGVTAPESTVLPTEGNLIFANQWGDLKPASGSVSDSGGTIETIDDGDGKEDTVDLLLVSDCTMADGSAPFSAGTTWNLYLVDIVYSNWDAANSHLVNDILAEGEWQFSITFDETNGEYREMELLASPMTLKACIGWREDGTDALEAFAVTSFKLRKFSSSLQWDLIPDYHGTKDFGSSADFYGWSDQSGYHSACVVMKDSSEVTLPIRNKVIDLDQVDYVLLPDGTKLPATNTR